MGVVYKLKKEVVDYIIEQKRSNPRLSCRKLSALIQERFQTKVSKSSVNEVIKTANLSSPIGRRAKSSKKSQKFKIPQQRKDQISTDTKEHLIDYKKNEIHLPELRHEYPLENQPSKDLVKEPKIAKPEDLDDFRMSREEVLEESEPIQLPHEPIPTESLQEPGKKAEEEIVEIPTEKIDKKSSEMSKEEIQKKDTDSQLPQEALIEEGMSKETISEETDKAQLQDKTTKKEPDSVTQELDGSESLLKDPFTAEEEELKRQYKPVTDEEMPLATALPEESQIQASQEQPEPILKGDAPSEIPPQEESQLDEIVAEKPKETEEVEAPKENEEHPSLLPDPLEAISKDEDQDRDQQEDTVKAEVAPKSDEPYKELSEEEIGKTQEETPLSLEELVPKEKLPEPEEKEAEKAVDTEPAVQEPVSKEDISKKGFSAAPVQKEVQEEAQEEVQEEAQEEVQEEAQEEVQEEAQEEVQEEAQEEVQEEVPAKEVADIAPKEAIDDKVWTPDSGELTQKEVTRPRSIAEIGILYDSMGCFFLKAAEWELSNSSILGNLLRNNISICNVKDVNAAAEVLLYLEAFGIYRAEGLKDYKDEGLWKLNGIDEKLSLESLSKVIEGVQNLKRLSVVMSNEYSQIFSEISYIKITLSDGTELCVDAKLKTIWSEDNVHSAFTATLNKSLTVLSESFMSNVNPVIICSSPGFKVLSNQFYELVWSFENILDKNITKMGIFDGKKEEIAKFTSIPNKKRNFIIGVWPWQEECQKFIKEDLRVVNQFYVEGIDREAYFSELKTTLNQPLIGQSVNIRVALLRESGLDWPVLAIVTNVPQRQMSIEDVISKYLLQHPNLKEGHEDFSTKTEKATYGAVTITPAHDRVVLLKEEGHYNLLEGAADFWTNVEFLLSGLNNYCQRHFFPAHYEQLDFSTIKERFYGLPGYVEHKEGMLIVSILTPHDYMYEKDLQYAIRRLNENNVKDYAGNRLIMRIMPRKDN